MTLPVDPSTPAQDAERLLTYGVMPLPPGPQLAGAMEIDQAMAVARNILVGAKAWETQRLAMLTEALRPNRPAWALGMEVPRDAPAVMHRLAYKAQANFLPLVVETFSQVMKVSDYISSDSMETAQGWDYWQANQMDARQTGIHSSALKYGTSYVVCLPGNASNGNIPVMKGVSPINMTAVYDDPINDQWPAFAIQTDRRMLYLYDQNFVYRFGLPNIPTSSFGWPDWQQVATLQYISMSYHGVGVCPVVRFRDKMLLEGEQQYGIVEPLLTVQQRINETNFGTLASQYFTAFRQRYVTGWMPQTERELLKMAASEIWTFKDPDVKLGTFDEASPDFYVKAKQDVMQDLSSLAQVPPQNLGIGNIANINAETLTALEEGKTRKVDEITTSLGESWEQALRLCSHIAGDAQGALDFASTVKWADATARAFSATVDALGKLGQMLGVPDEILWPDIPGWDHAKVERAKAVRDEAGELEALLLQSAQAAPAVERGLQAAQAADPNDQIGQ